MWLILSSLFPSFSGLVAVLLYHDGRRCLVSAIRTLLQSREGLTWTLELDDEMLELIMSFTKQMMEEGNVNWLSMPNCIKFCSPNWLLLWLYSVFWNIVVIVLGSFMPYIFYTFIWQIYICYLSTCIYNYVTFKCLKTANTWNISCTYTCFTVVRTMKFHWNNIGDTVFWLADKLSKKWYYTVYCIIKKNKQISFNTCTYISSTGKRKL